MSMTRIDEGQGPSVGPQRSSPDRSEEQVRIISIADMIRLRTAFSAKHNISAQWSLAEPVRIRERNWFLGNATRNTGQRICDSTPEDHELAFIGLVDFKTLKGEHQTALAAEASGRSDELAARVGREPAKFYAVFANLTEENRFPIVTPG